MKYLKEKFERIIERDTGRVAGWMVYKTSEDFKERVFAVSWVHPKDNYDREEGKRLALLRMQNGYTYTISDKDNPIVPEHISSNVAMYGISSIPFRTQKMFVIKNMAFCNREFWQYR